MAGEKTPLLSTERLVFIVLAALLGLFLWRTARVQPLPDVPGAPRQRGVKMVDGQPEPTAALAAIGAPDFWAPGARNPFGPAQDSLRVVAATVFSLVRVSAAEATADVRVDYRILPHQLAKFEFLLPPDVKLLQVDGDGVVDKLNPEMRNLGQDGNQFTIRRRSPVDKKYTLNLRLTWARKPGAHTISVPDILLPDATHERGVIAIAPAPGSQVAVVATQNVSPVPVDKLPPELAAKDCSAAFRYASHPYSIDLEISRRPEPTITKTTTGGIDSAPTKPGPTTKIDTQPSRTAGAQPSTVNPWKVPVKFKGTVTVGIRRAVLLEGAGQIVQKFEGDTHLGIEILEVRPTSVILRNEKGELFKFRDKASEDNQF